MKTRITSSQTTGLKAGGLAIFNPEVHQHSDDVFLVLDMERLHKIIEAQKGHHHDLVVLIHINDTPVGYGWDYKSSAAYVPVEQVGALEVRRI